MGPEISLNRSSQWSGLISTPQNAKCSNLSYPRHICLSLGTFCSAPLRTTHADPAHLSEALTADRCSALPSAQGPLLVHDALRVHRVLSSENTEVVALTVPVGTTLDFEKCFSDPNLLELA